MNGRLGLMQQAEMVEIHSGVSGVTRMAPSAVRGPHHPLVTLDNPLAHPLTFGRSADFSSSWGSPTHAMSVVQTSAPPHMLQAPGAAAPLGSAAAQACDLRTLFFGHVPDRVQEQELLHIFSRCGPVVDVVLFKQFPKSKYSRGCGLVEFVTEQAAAAALAVLNGAHIWPDTRAPLNLEYMVATKCQRGPQPRTKQPRPLFGADAAPWNTGASGVHLTPAEAADKQARTLFFAAVPPRIIDAELRKLFASCGEVVELLLFRRYPKCIPSKGCGLVEFQTKEQADFALASLNNNVMWPDSFKPMLVEPGLSATDRSQRRANTEHSSSATGGTTPGVCSQQLDAAAAAAAGLLLVPGPGSAAGAEGGANGSSSGSSASGTPTFLAASSSAAMAFTTLCEAPGGLGAAAMAGSSSGTAALDNSALLGLPGGAGMLPGTRPTQTQLAAAAMAAQRESGGKEGAVQTSFTLLEPLKGPPPPSPAAPPQPRSARPRGGPASEQQRPGQAQGAAPRVYGWYGSQQQPQYGNCAGAAPAAMHYVAGGAAYSMAAAPAVVGPQDRAGHHQQLHELAGVSPQQPQQVVWMVPGAGNACAAVPYPVNEATAAYTHYMPWSLDPSLAVATGSRTAAMPAAAVSTPLGDATSFEHFPPQSSGPVTGVHALLAASAGVPVDVLAPAFAGQLDLGPAGGGLMLGGAAAGVGGQPAAAASSMALGPGGHSASMLLELLQQQQGLSGPPQHVLGHQPSPFMPAAQVAGPHASGPAVVATPAVPLGVSPFERGVLMGQVPVAACGAPHGSAAPSGQYRLV